MRGSMLGVRRNTGQYTETTWSDPAEMEVTIHVPDDFEEKNDSFLVNFVNGQLLPSSSTKPTFTLYHKTNDRTKRRKIMVAETSHLSYVGTNYDPESVTSTGSSTCRYCIGALDRETDTMTLHNAEQFTLKPCIPGVDLTDAPEEETPKKQDYHQTVDQMVKLFGSEKQKRAFSAAKRNLVEAGALESALATALSQAEKEMEDAATDSSSQQNSGLMPPHNAAAESPQDVYNLESIISLSELKLLRKAAKVFTKATVADVRTWREEKKFPEYVLQHISTLPSGEPHKSLKAAILLYISFLAKIHNLRGRKFGQQGFQFQPGVVPPSEVSEQLLKNFTERQVGGGKEGKDAFILSARMKDKIRLHLFVLTLIVDDFTVDCLPLQQDLKLTAAKMMDHYRALGCTVSKTAVKRKAPQDEGDSPPDTTTAAVSSCTAVLKIPLNFPKPRKQKN